MGWIFNTGYREWQLIEKSVNVLKHNGYCIIGTTNSNSNVAREQPSQIPWSSTVSWFELHSEAVALFNFSSKPLLPLPKSISTRAAVGNLSVGEEVMVGKPQLQSDDKSPLVHCDEVRAAGQPDAWNAVFATLPFLSKAFIFSLNSFCSFLLPLSLPFIHSQVSRVERDHYPQCFHVPWALTVYINLPFLEQSLETLPQLLLLDYSSLSGQIHPTLFPFLRVCLLSAGPIPWISSHSILDLSSVLY